VFGKTVLCKLLLGAIGLCECGHLCTPLLQSLIIHTFLDIKYLHSAWIADAASFHGSGVSNCLCLSTCILIYDHSAIVFPIYLIIFNCV
jgi:hypothetical protein